MPVAETNIRARAGAGLLIGLSLILAGPAGAQDKTSFDCVVRPSKEVKLSSPVASVIDSVAVDRGDVVRAGSVIAVLNSDVERATVDLTRLRSEADAKIASAAARVDFLTRKLDRNKKLNQTRIVSDGALDEIQTDLAVARQALEDARFDQRIAQMELQRAIAILNQRTIRSPIDGVVTERRLSPGEYWTEQQSVVTIAALDPLYVEAFLPIGLHGRLRIGGAATVAMEEPIGGRHPASIAVIDRVYDAASGTLGVRLTLANKDLSIPGGIRCKVTFEGL